MDAAGEGMPVGQRRGAGVVVLATVALALGGVGQIVAAAGTAASAQPALAPLDLGAGDPRLDPADYSVTRFAAELSYPLGMTELPDGSLLVGTSSPTGGSYFASTGALVCLVDADGDGVADGPGQTLAADLPGPITAVRRAGTLVYTVSPQPTGSSIGVFRTGRVPSAQLTPLGSIDLGYAEPMQHATYALAVRPIPGAPERHDLFFNVGAAGNDVGGADVTLGGLAEGTLVDASISRLTVDASGDAPSFSDLTLIATGLRNAAGIALDPATGDLWFEDNGIDGSENPLVPLSADELNVIPAAEIGGEPEDFGFPAAYVDYATGRPVGGAGLPPAVAFLPRGGDESEGAAEIAILPPDFPAPLGGTLAVGFHGQWDEVGLDNEENPLLAVDPGTGETIPLVGNGEPAVGHLDGLLATADALFVADLSGPASLFGDEPSGVIYRIAPVE